MPPVLRRALIALAALSVAALGFVLGRGALTPASETVPPPPPAPYAEEPAPAADEALALDETAAPEPPAFERPERPTRRDWRQGQERRERLREELRGGRAPAGETLRGGRGAGAGASLPLARAIAEHASGVWVEGEGEVRRSLRDDLRGRRHQRFVIELEDGGTLLVAHNTQLAERAPAEPGARIRFRGRYEWNRRGGIVHWTHRDPRGAGGGWLEVDGRRYD